MSVPAQAPYNLGFTAASLRPELARILADAYLAAGDWEIAKERVLASNALQCRSFASAVRLERELRQRLERLTNEELKLMANSAGDGRNAVAWLAAVKHIQFAYEFASEMLRAKVEAHDPVLRRSDYESFLAAKAVVHPELRNLADSSRAKLKQVLLRMLTEAGLLVPGPALGTITRGILPHAVYQAIVEDNPLWLAGFLVPDDEIRGHHAR
jgi:hypothetical protein